LTESDSRLKEMIIVRNNMTIAAGMTKDRFDARMRMTVKDLLGYRYASLRVPIEVARGVREEVYHFELAGILGDGLVGSGPQKLRPSLGSISLWNRYRPIRVYGYLQRLVDSFPAMYLTVLLRTSLNHTAEETIALYEGNKGEAIRNDYAGQPTAIDLTSIPVTVKPIRENE
jgi:hypothetical protein